MRQSGFQTGSGGHSDAGTVCVDVDVKPFIGARGRLLKPYVRARMGRFRARFDLSLNRSYHLCAFVAHRTGCLVRSAAHEHDGGFKILIKFDSSPHFVCPPCPPTVCLALSLPDPMGRARVTPDRNWVAARRVECRAASININVAIAERPHGDRKQSTGSRSTLQRNRAAPMGTEQICRSNVRN